MTHRENYDLFLKKLNDEGIIYVIIRGFRFLPHNTDTDLDTVIHPKSYEKFKRVCELFFKNGVMRSGKRKIQTA